MADLIITIDDTQEEVTIFVGSSTITKHSQLILDGGTNPHNTTIADVDPNASNIAYKDEANTFTQPQTATGYKTPENDPNKALFSDGSVKVMPRSIDRHLDMGTIAGATLNLDFSLAETFTAVITQDTKIDVINPEVKVVTLDLTGNFVVTDVTNSDVVGDSYDGTKKNKLTIEWKSATDILTINTIRN